MTLILRLAEESDRPALRALFLAVRRATYAWQAPASFALADFDAQTEGERLFAAFDGGGRVAGFLSLWEPDSFIHHLYVDRPWQRRGVGQALLRALPGWPATRYRLKCLRRNAGALGFYRACGFAIIGSGVSEDGEYVLLESGQAPAA